MKCDYLVVGAGAFGLVVAERLANQSGAEVVVIERRDHIGGNCYSRRDPITGIEYHVYGTHIYHTSSRVVNDYVSRFTEINGYHHQVLTMHRGRNRVYQMPINLDTINAFYRGYYTPEQARKIIASELAKESYPNPRNLQEKAISLIGRPLYEAFIRGYTIKQWEMDPTELPAEIITRLPVRFDYCRSYFNESRWQGIPLDGYTRMFERMIDSPRIKVETQCDFFDHRDEFDVKRCTIFTGPIDRYFDYCHGKLEWRAVEFTQEVVDTGDFQGTSVMNYADAEVPFTRIHEPRHLHPEREYPQSRSIIFRETSKHESDDPYYPINTARNRTILAQYQEMAAKLPDVIFGGRLGGYAYYDMDRTVLAALECYEKRIAPGG